MPLILMTVMLLGLGDDFPWLQEPEERRVASLPVPEGYQRLELEADSFGTWLRKLPLLPGRGRVMLHNGLPKANQSAHHAVVQLDLSKRDLQQCADATMRLRAEYLWAAGRAEEICFRFTNGDPARWIDWRRGIRPHVKGNEVAWKAAAAPNGDYANFRAYQERVFIYAGSASLERELLEVADPRQIAPGDVFIQGGYPGHAVMVLDVAVDKAGKRKFILGQSYMPAQQFHVLRGPDGEDPWYPARASGTLRTPEWSFQYSDLRRFGPTCAGK